MKYSGSRRGCMGCKTSKKDRSTSDVAQEHGEDCSMAEKRENEVTEVATEGFRQWKAAKAVKIRNSSLVF